MPVKTGIHLRIRWTRKNLDSGLHRNDEGRIDVQPKCPRKFR